VTIVLDAGDDRVEVDPQAGGRLASLVAGGRERLLTRRSEEGLPDVLG
jgi:hypothetical protein